jgi:hypothetical protein
MTRSQLAVCLSSLVAIGGAFACGNSGNGGDTGSGGSSFSCGTAGQKLCPNDEPETQAAVDLCNRCYSQEAAVAQCLGAAATPTCGADGTTEYPSTDLATTDKCASVLQPYYACLGLTAADGGLGDGDDAGSGVTNPGEPFDSGSSGAALQLNFAGGCQISVASPEGAKTGSCPPNQALMTISTDEVSIFLPGDVANVTMDFLVSGIVTGTTYTLSASNTPAENDNLLIVNQDSNTCRAFAQSTVSPALPGPDASLSVTFSAFDPTNNVAHGTLTGMTACTDADGDPDDYGATATFTF